MNNLICFSLLISLLLVSLKANWKKHQYPKFENISDSQFSSLYLNLEMTDLSLHYKPKTYDFFSSSNILPDNFDSRSRWPGCVHEIINQVNYFFMNAIIIKIVMICKKSIGLFFFCYFFFLKKFFSFNFFFNYFVNNNFIVLLWFLLCFILNFSIIR